MSLVLQGIALNEEPLSQPLVGRFDERGGTVGRSDNATFTLPDPERMISRTQAQILYRDDCYWIENVSAASSILHNGRPMGAGMRVMVREGDEIRIGGYTLLASAENDDATAAILRGRTGVIRRAGELSSAAPVGFGPAGVGGLAAGAGASAGIGAQAGMGIPAGVSAQGALNAQPRGPAVNDALKLNGSQSAAASINGSAGGGGLQGGDIANTGPALVDPQALWHAFQQATGVELVPPPGGLTPEVAATIGLVLQTAVEGIHQLIAMRATAKDEMRAELTMIQLSGNNPIKVAPDAGVALQLLLQPPARGFLPGRQAIQEAMIDLQAHLIGLTAGLRSALEAVLDRFDPAKVEAQLTKRSVLESLLPSHHRAKLWELYLEHYRSLRAEAQEDFQRLFGEAFREAYEEQVRNVDEALAFPTSTEPGARDSQ